MVKETQEELITFTKEEFNKLIRHVHMTGGHMYMSFGNFFSGIGDIKESTDNADKEFKKLVDMLEEKVKEK